PPIAAPSRLRFTSALLLVVTFIQIYFGALVAGLRAGRAYNTWPQIDGASIPSGERLWFETPWWRNMFDNVLTVQFEHRMTAYASPAVVAYPANCGCSCRCRRPARLAHPDRSRHKPAAAPVAERQPAASAWPANRRQSQLRPLASPQGQAPSSAASSAPNQK